jgi:hypothetical protein
MANASSGGGNTQPKARPMGWAYSGELHAKSADKPDQTGGANTGYKHGRVNRSKRLRK